MNEKKIEEERERKKRNINKQRIVNYSCIWHLFSFQWNKKWCGKCKIKQKPNMYTEIIFWFEAKLKYETKFDEKSWHQNRYRWVQLQWMEMHELQSFFFIIHIQKWHVTACHRAKVHEVWSKLAEHHRHAKVIWITWLKAFNVVFHLLASSNYIVSRI